MNKNKISDLRKTLDAKHKDIIKSFKERKKSLPQKKKEINNLKKILEKETDFEEIFIIEKNINDIEEEIAQIENNFEEDDYFLKTSDLLYKYYCPKENLPENESDESDEVVSNNINSKTKSISYYFNKENDENGEKDTTSKKQKTVNKAKILDKFLMITEVDHTPITLNKQEICESCQTEMEIKKLEGIIVCTNCGFSKLHTITSNKPSYKESIPENNYFAYKRINHFNEWLSQFQAKESTDIPQDVFDLLIQEIKKGRIQNMAKVTPSKIREFLKKLGLNKYYEHTAYILNRLNGETPPTMTRETEEKLRVMFREIQYPFMKHCPKKRVNFLSYSYVLHKFVELLGLDEYIKCFPLLKSRNKLEEQDKIWLNICKELKWEYIPSM
jgi:hypothetical protein